MADDDPTAHRSPEETPTVVVDERTTRRLQMTPGTIIGGRYRIVSMLGRGGMGEVYRADDLKLGQNVALKFLSHHEHAQRLYEEVRIGRQITHPNVCRLYDVAEADGQLFITMELVDGEDLASLLRRVGRLPAEKAIAVCRDICAGVAAAHEKGVIHRDLKPANVMVDGRGRARVTDFGLAVAAEGVSDSSGTPAYMAPEQLAGEPATMKSDIYSLGLVLYEIFTGRRTFEPASTHDLMMRQRAAEFTRPSAVTREVPSAVERVIVRCLDPDPNARPSSVEEIVRELPGGDPLAAAIAAGETPSPAMVAAAAKSGELPALVAWSFMFVALLGIGVAAKLSERTMLYRVSDVKAPDVLQERAREILRAAGVTARAADSDIFVTREANRLIAIYRQSDAPLRAQNANARLSSNDPPLEPGMANVTLDGNGDLLHFVVVPPRIDRSIMAVDPDWDRFIRAAGYEPRSLIATAPERAADVDTDRKLAWLTRDGKRIEAAQFHRRPVWFAVVERGAPAKAARSTVDRLAGAMEAIFLIVLPAAGLVLARAHLRRGQGDRGGATRIGSFFLIASLIALVFRGHHPLAFMEEWMAVSWHVAQGTFWALMAGLMYIALEPVVRKRWPEMLISWTRLMSGRFTDPMVGRDVLLGAAGGALASLLWHMTFLVSQTATLGPTTALGPWRFALAWIASSLAEAVLRGIGLVVLFVLLRALIPSDTIAALMTIFLISVMTLGDATGPLMLRLFFAVPAVWVGVALVRHFGLLASVSYAFFALIPRRLPMTLDADAWYFGRSVMVMLLLTAIVVYAFRVSVGAKRWLPRFALDS